MGRKQETGCLIQLVSSTKVNDATRLTTMLLKQPNYFYSDLMRVDHMRIYQVISIRWCCENWPCDTELFLERRECPSSTGQGLFIAKHKKIPSAFHTAHDSLLLSTHSVIQSLSVKDFAEVQLGEGGRGFGYFPLGKFSLGQHWPNENVEVDKVKGGNWQSEHKRVGSMLWLWYV